MATFSKTILSGSTDGKAVKVTGTSTSATVTVHTGPTNTAHLHEVWIYANNTSGTDVKLTLEWGTATAADGNIEYTVKAENGLSLIIPGLLLKGNATALIIKAFAGTADVILLTGYVNVIA
jgi:hypothetical protein